MQGSWREMEAWWPLDGQSGVGVIFLTLAFFLLLQHFLQFLPLPSVVAQTEDRFRIFRWRNLVISWIHACMTGSWTLLCFLFYGEELLKDMLSFKNWLCYSVTCFSTGYFIYDTLDIIKERRIREKWEILIHHAAVMWSALYSVLSVGCVGYHVLAMSIEVNTAFLHLRKLLQLAAVPRTNWLLQVNRYMNLVTFLLFRFAPLILLSYAIFRDGDRVPFWFLVQFSLSMFVLNIVNCILFYRLLKADVWLSFRPRAHRELLGHRKLDSTAGVCGSLQVAEDCNGVDKSHPH